MDQRKTRITPESEGSLQLLVRKSLPWLWLAAATLSFLAFTFAVVIDVDLWWHLATGRWIVEHRALPKADPFAYTTAGRTWVVDAWLADVILYLWSRAFSTEALVYWRWALIVATFLLLFYLLARLSENQWLAAYLATLAAIAAGAPLLDFRPQLYSLLCFVILLSLGTRAERISWTVAPLFLLWSNLHAGFVFGLGMLGILLLPRLARRHTRREAALQLLACVAVSFLNPNGPRVLHQPILYALEPHSAFQTIVEWTPPFLPGGIRSPLYPFLIALFAIAAIDTLRRRRHERLALTGLVVAAVTLVMSLRSRRFIPYFAIGQSLVLAPTLAYYLRSLITRIPVWIPPTVTAIAALIVLARYPLTPRAFPYLSVRFHFPVETMNFIDANRLAGNVFAHGFWGGYVHFRTYGRMKTFVDPRASAVFDDEVYARYLDVVRLEPGWGNLIESSGADFFLWERSEKEVVHQLIASGRWRMLHEDAFSILLVKSSTTLPKQLVNTPESAYRQLALGLFALERGSYREAEQHARRALALERGLPPACEVAAKALRARGLDAEGANIMDQCSEYFPWPYRSFTTEGALDSR